MSAPCPRRARRRCTSPDRRPAAPRRSCGGDLRAVSTGLAREVVRTLQEGRKTAGLEVSDRITVEWSSADSDLSAGGSDLSWQTQRVDGGTIFPGNGGSRDPQAPRQVPFAPDYIRKIQKRGTIGKKRKSAKC